MDPLASTLIEITVAWILGSFAFGGLCVLAYRYFKERP